MKIIAAKPTVYNEITFRSRLEADWARLLDSWGIPWAYEEQGYQFEDGTRYLPDFYLLEQDCYLEVKGVMSDFDRHKIECLARESCKNVAIGLPRGYFALYDTTRSMGENINFVPMRFAAVVMCDECKTSYFYDSRDEPFCHICFEKSHKARAGGLCSVGHVANFYVFGVTRQYRALPSA